MDIAALIREPVLGDWQAKEHKCVPMARLPFVDDTGIMLPLLVVGAR